MLGMKAGQVLMVHREYDAQAEAAKHVEAQRIQLQVFWLLYQLPDALSHMTRVAAVVARSPSSAKAARKHMREAGMSTMMTTAVTMNHIT